VSIVANIHPPSVELLYFRGNLANDKVGENGG
jgi:hypothetical protein